MPVTFASWLYNCGKLPSNVVPSWVSTSFHSGSWYGFTCVGVPNVDPVSVVR
jgi:hypothetical protein